MLEILLALMMLAALIGPPTVVIVMLVVLPLRAWARHRVLQTGLRGVARVESLDYRYRSLLSGRSVWRLSLSVAPENGAPPFAARLLWGEPPGASFYTSQPLLVRYRGGSKPRVVLDEPGMVAAGLLPPERHSVLAIIGRAALFILIALAASSGLVMAVITGAGRDRASGQIDADGARLGTWTLEAHRCRNGVHDGFFGVTMQNEDGGLWIRLLRNPEGEPSVLARMPGTDRALRFSQQNCAQLDADIQETGTIYNNVRGLKGSLTLSCAIDGSTLKGHVDFDQCS
jgi:hypothetical protein